MNDGLVVRKAVIWVPFGDKKNLFIIVCYLIELLIMTETSWLSPDIVIMS